MGAVLILMGYEYMSPRMRRIVTRPCYVGQRLQAKRFLLVPSTVSDMWYR